MGRKRLLKKTFLILGMFLLLLSNRCQSVLGLEAFKVTQYVTDRANMLSDDETAQLTCLLYDFYQNTRNQILVVTIPSLEGTDPVSFTESLFELNKPGKKGKDNGIIMLIAAKERKIRLEVGYGLEAAVPDGKAGTVIRDIITPRFQEKDYYGGISSGVLAIINAITPEYSPSYLEASPVRSLPPKTEKKDHSLPFAFLTAILIFLFSGLGNLRGRHRTIMRRSRGYSEPWYWGGGGFGDGSASGGSDGMDSGGFNGDGGSFGGGGASGDW